MADPPLPSRPLIAGRFAVDPSVLLADAGGGVPAYLARDRQAGDAHRVALLVSRDASPRLNALNALTDPMDNLMTPLGRGIAPAPGEKADGYYIVCSPPPGPPVSASLRAWPERALIDQVLRPVARALDTLQGFGVTHRSIRLDNVFQSVPGQPVTLGAAWAEPPAMRQPAVFEPPYSAICHPAARGDGTIADDIYALGVLLLALAGGKALFAEQDSAVVTRAKLSVGSFQALTRDVQISGFLGDLLRGMLADEAEHRPSPALLLDPGAARARRVAARPARSSQHPLIVNDIPAFEARTLAYALSRDDKKAVQALRGDLVTTWLRRAVGDAALASAVEELVRDRMAQTRPGPRSDAMLVMRVIAALNPRMPLCWRGVALMPGGLDDLLAAAVVSGSELQAVVEEIVLNDIIEAWAGAQAGPEARRRPVDRDMAALRRLLQGSGVGGMLRVFYTRHPLLPCRVPALAAGWVVTMADLMVALDRLATGTEGALIDRHLAAFIAARGDTQASGQVATLMGREEPDRFRLAELGMLRDMQKRHYARPLPGLGRWAAARVRPDLEKWRNRPRRAAMTAQLESFAQTGDLANILRLVLDPASRAEDENGARQAEAELAFVNAQLRSISDHDRVRSEHTQQLGHAMTGAIGLIILMMTVVSLVSR